MCKVARGEESFQAGCKVPKSSAILSLFLHVAVSVRTTRICFLF